MRAKWYSLAVIAAIWMSQSAFGQDGYCDSCQNCDPCNGCGGLHGCGPWGHHAAKAAARNAERYANCGCNGSYKFPVPPLYTYHWPGMYQQVLMTDYHSPWRFPPLKPYVDEVVPEVIGQGIRLRPLTPVSMVTETSGDEKSDSFSERVRRMK